MSIKISEENEFSLKSKMIVIFLIITFLIVITSLIIVYRPQYSNKNKITLTYIGYHSDIDSSNSSVGYTNSNTGCVFLGVKTDKDLPKSKSKDDRYFVMKDDTDGLETRALWMDCNNTQTYTNYYPYYNLYFIDNDNQIIGTSYRFGIHFFIVNKRNESTPTYCKIWNISDRLIIPQVKFPKILINCTWYLNK
uniref:Sodium/potassium-transporting ATPase subunit beta-like protein n=1 Tax=Trachysalambria curvirostris majanivirus TaxID=2984281 RepID=A0A9C7F882_9VIRU|nr:MAG: sodium/potassium-transporting ATPase subunit beta-like protein [Trachysalambria curvirostris majanivirus]